MANDWSEGSFSSPGHLAAWAKVFGVDDPVTGLPFGQFFGYSGLPTLRILIPLFAILLLSSPMLHAFGVFSFLSSIPATILDYLSVFLVQPLWRLLLNTFPERFRRRFVAKPAVPLHLRCVALSQTELEISWRSGRADQRSFYCRLFDAEEFVVEAAQTDDTWTVLAVLDAEDLSLVVDKLKPGFYRLFRVRSRNGLGEVSAAGKPVAGRTPEPPNAEDGGNGPQVNMTQRFGDLEANADQESVVEEPLRPSYTWGQTKSQVTVRVPLPIWVRGRDVNVAVKADSLRVSLRSNEKQVINGELFARVRPDELTWDLEEGGSLCLQLEKVTESEKWPKLYKADSLAIDVSQVVFGNKWMKNYSESLGLSGLNPE